MEQIELKGVLTLGISGKQKKPKQTKQRFVARIFINKYLLPGVCVCVLYAPL